VAFTAPSSKDIWTKQGIVLIPPENKSIRKIEKVSMRSVAEAQLVCTPLTALPSRSIEKLLHELQAHPVELEMQHEEWQQEIAGRNSIRIFNSSTPMPAEYHQQEAGAEKI
jgi:hypothetical protein